MVGWRKDFYAALLAAGAALPGAAHAYTAAGDRLFPATILLPQNGPSDDLYFTTSTQPLHSGTLPNATDQLTNASVVFNKTLTERLSVGVEDGWNRFDRGGGLGTASGWQNLETTVKYLAVLDPDNEFLLSVGADREWANGALGIGASASGATTPGVYFGKGFGGLPAPWLRPLAISGTLGYQLADRNTRPDLIQAGIALEYSIPYLAAKVARVNLPDFVRAMTPMVELLFTTPPSATRGATTTLQIAPGVNYAAEGWEVNVAALIPATRATGSGFGFTAQLHFALDYLFPDSIGRPLFARQ